MATASPHFYRSELDATGPLNADKTVLYRLTVAGQKAGSFIDYANRDLAAIAPSVTWLMSSRSQGPDGATAGLHLERSCRVRCDGKKRFPVMKEKPAHVLVQQYRQGRIGIELQD